MRFPDESFNQALADPTTEEYFQLRDEIKTVSATYMADPGGGAGDHDLSNPDIFF